MTLKLIWLIRITLVHNYVITSFVYNTITKTPFLINVSLGFVIRNNDNIFGFAVTYNVRTSEVMWITNQNKLLIKMPLCIYVYVNG